MRIWIDAHISPGIAAWLSETSDYKVQSLRGLGLRDADDLTIFMRAKEADVIFVTKDSDFVDLVEARGAPPKVILLKTGNTTNRRLREIFASHLDEVVSRFMDGETIVEIR
ncbi:DUF5615 family PIN-like protein [Pelagicoccus mobilis]|uniref:DUF5615 family PIN-like protein n=1 Tax=Pelagicoccus mobilis TaxID=415221 RepID=A0A934RVQ7_9BACT|nr:DUF5615 family PIN-like protein [Pelagicoccus mobilis]MBK1875686.1 DUF5615 family PIN-like protein [Pelagicoccus mobilis]